ncbi:MAG TPA: hypothetical protein VGO69_01190, partial [Pyrinomonadaceae bacterium]|nr:hypothetical protein [Pyrinomonadaceae bacterium]
MSQHCIIEFDGHMWDSWKHPRLFNRVSVELSTNEASEASWRVFDPEFRLIDKYSLADGVPLVVIRVWLGHGQNLGEPVFKGLLARVERGENTTTFRAYDVSFAMRLEQRPDYHKGDDLAIIKKLVERNYYTDSQGRKVNLRFVGPAHPLRLEPHDAMTQDEQTDWEHASERAHDAGLVLFTRGDTVFAAYPAKVGTSKLTLSYRHDLILLRDFDLAFKVPENREGRPRQVEVHGRGRGGKRLTGKSDESRRGTRQLSLKRDLPKHSQRAASARAQAQKELEREHAFTASVRSLMPASNLRADVRDTIRLENVGKLFSGLYLCDSVA